MCKVANLVVVYFPILKLPKISSLGEILRILQDFLRIPEEFFKNSSGLFEEFFKNFQAKEIDDNEDFKTSIDWLSYQKFYADHIPANAPLF